MATAKSEPELVDEIVRLECATENVESKLIKNDDVPSTVLEEHGYKVGKIIGTGSYSKVKLAFSRDEGCVVAIKIITKKLNRNKEFLNKFLPRELSAITKLKHENLLRYFHNIETTHRIYIVMEYAENGSLLDLLHQHNYLEESQARNIFAQLMRVVNYIHNQGFAHRDIKCENILFDKMNKLKLIDFGFARNINKQPQSSNETVILSNTFCGSYVYASPEILKGIPYEANNSDIWACGVVLFAMVFGVMPFNESNFSVLRRQVENKISFPRHPVVSHNCCVLIQKILSPLNKRANINDIKTSKWMLSIPSNAIKAEIQIHDNLQKTNTNQTN